MIKNIVSMLSNAVYWINDPTTPGLQEPPVIPPNPKLSFSVAGLKPKQPNFPTHKQAVNCHITAARALNYFETMYNRFSTPIVRWSAGDTLQIYPRAGKKLNAYYNRKGIFFFFDNDPQTKQVIFTCDSADIVAHELGHAILDSMRPDLWNLQSLETWAFHEAFADITALAGITQSDIAIDYALQETNGNLRLSNVISRIAEQLGNVARKQDFLRDATKPYNYCPPASLPKTGPHDELCAEMHSFGRVFLTAWYEILMRIFEKECGLLSQRDAFKKARDEAYLLMLKAAKTAPVTAEFTESICKTMLHADRMAGGVHGAILDAVFTERKIVKPQIKMLSSATWDQVLPNLRRDDNIIRKQGLSLVCRNRTKSIKLNEHRVTALNENPLYDVQIEIPKQEMFFFDQGGRLIDEIRTDETASIDDAILCLEQIQMEGLGNSWDIKDGRLIRNYVV